MGSIKKFFSEYHFRKRLRPESGLGKCKLPPEAETRIFMTGLGLVDGLDRMGGSLVALTQVAMLNGDGIDYFIETPALANSIIGMVREFTADVLDIFCEFRRTAFVIHPVSPRPAVLVGIRTIGGQTVAVCCRNIRGGQLVGYLGPDAFVGGEKRQSDIYAVRLAVGLALYIRCFPHAVKDGLPETATHPNHYRRSKCASVGMVEELIDRSGPKPHFRNMCIRFLSSEKWTHKQGQYVVSRACYVHGKCKIVVEVED